MTGLRVGVMLPTFTTDPSLALEAAQIADDGGLDGVFSFDHLWPMGSPGRPALWSFAVLGAVAARARRVNVGTLIARIDLSPEVELVRQFETLAAIVGPERVIAGIGTGDDLSLPENHAYGYPLLPLDERLAMVGRVADRLRHIGVESWIGGTSPAVESLARAHTSTLNLWGVGAARMARPGHVPRKTWGGQVLVGRTAAELADLRARYGERRGLVSGTVDEVASVLQELRDAGAGWAVCAPLDYIDQPARATETVCLVREAVH